MSGSTSWERGVTCERGPLALEEMEELALGTLSADRAHDAEEHRRACASCAEIHAMFAEERALFAARASVILAPLPPARPILGRRLPSSRDLWSMTRVAAAAFACAAAIVCVLRDRSTSAQYVVTNVANAPEPPALHATVEEGLACAYPASGFSRASLASVVPRSTTGQTGQTGLVFVSNDVGVCEERVAISSGP